MPRKTLRAAAVSVLLAAGAIPSAQAADRPTIHRFSSSPAASEEQPSETKAARRFFPFGKKSETQTAEQPAIRRFGAAPARTEAPVEAQPSKVAGAFGRLKSAIGLGERDEAARRDARPMPSSVANAAHRPAGTPKIVQTGGERSQQVAYDDDEVAAPPAGLAAPPAGLAAPPAALAAPPAALPVPRDPVPPPAPAVGPSTAPAYSPVPVPGYAAGAPIAPGYPYLNAPLNPTPIPNVPYQVGSTIITNQALYPHELQYPHEYKAMYPPFYYKVRGHWMVTPWGVVSHDRWELQGTEVKVKYRSHYGFHSMFHPPVLR